MNDAGAYYRGGALSGGFRGMKQRRYLRVEYQFTGAFKLRTTAPELPPRFLQRPRLDSMLARGSQKSVTIVCAGAGYGKTLAIAAWIRRSDLPGPVTWLTVDDAYDMRSFWTDLLDALRISDVLPGSSTLRDISPGPQFGIRELNRIVEALTQLPDPVVLVLDDFQNIKDGQALDFLNHVVEQRIPQLRLVLVTRAEPRLRLSRLRLEGHVTEIGADDLAFTEGEAHGVCVLSGHPLAGREFADLLRRTQGWPAGLRLALLNLSDSRAAGESRLHEFGANNRRVAEYLLEEVLDQLSASDRRFLLATSVADQMTAELARTLSGRVDSQQVLEGLVARNALTVRLSDRPGWFQYHPLLRELLRERLAAENPDSVYELNGLAADWYAAAAEPIVAIRHYSVARDWNAVMRVLSAVALPMVLSPHAAALVSALSVADAEAAVRPTVPTLLAAMVCAYQRHEFEAMSRHTDDAARLVEGSADPEAAATILIAVARLVRARTIAPGELTASAGKLMELANDLPRQRFPAAPAYTLIASNNHAIGLVLEGHLDEAYVGLTAARSGAEHARMGLLEIAATSYLSLIAVMSGDLVRARVTSAIAMDMAERRGWVNEPQRLAAVAAATLIHLHAHELEAAQEQIDSALSSALPETDVAGRLIVNIAAVGVATARADLVEARVRLKRLVTEQDAMGDLPDLLARWSRATHAEVMLLAGDPHEVLALVDDPGGEIDYASALERVVRAKALLALADPAGALDALGPAKQFSDYRVQATEAAICESIAYLRLHRDVAAVARFADAVALAQPMGLLAPFVSAGAQIATHLIRQEHLSDEYREFVGELIVATGPGTANADSVQVDPMRAVPAFTERELAVLQYLPTLLRASDIATDLFVSVNTVKTHLRGIYTKLGVNNRREAVRQARHLQLL